MMLKQLQLLAELNTSTPEAAMRLNVGVFFNIYVIKMRTVFYSQTMETNRQRTSQCLCIKS